MGARYLNPWHLAGRADHCRVTIPAEHWDRFETWVNAPAKENPALRALSSTHPAWRH